MSLRMPLIIRAGLCALALLTLFPASHACAQTNKPAKEHFAVKRSQDAAEVITKITALPAEQTIPAELLSRAVGIGVFPKVLKLNFFFEQALGGDGVISRRTASGWGLPVYYKFAAVDIDRQIAKLKSISVIVLFMDEALMSRLEKDRLSVDKKTKVAAGVIGSSLPADATRLQEAHIIAYQLTDEKLKGLELNWLFDKSAGFVHDNKSNQSAYGKKASEILASDQSSLAPTLPGVRAFRSALNESFRYPRIRQSY